MPISHTVSLAGRGGRRGGGGAGGSFKPFVTAVSRGNKAGCCERGRAGHIVHNRGLRIGRGKGKTRVGCRGMPVL